MKKTNNTNTIATETKTNAIVLGDETTRTINALLDSKSVAELRKLASTKGLKNAKQYKRDALVSKLFDILANEYIEKLAAEAEAKSKKSKNANKKSQKGMKKAVKGSNKSLEDDLAQVIEYITGRMADDPDEYAKDILIVYGREVLIKAMAFFHIKGWYRIYNKHVMVERLVGVVAA